MKTTNARIASIAAAIILALMMLFSGCAIRGNVHISTQITVPGHWKDPEQKKECIVGGGNECSVTVDVPIAGH